MTRPWMALMVTALAACDSGPTEVVEQSQLSEAEAEVVGDYDFITALDEEGVAIPVDSSRFAVRPTNADCSAPGNHPLAQSIGLTGYLTLAEVDRQAILIVEAYGRRCDDSTFSQRLSFLSRFVLQDRYLTITTTTLPFPGPEPFLATGSVSADSGLVRLDFGRPGLVLYSVLGADRQVVYLSRLTVRRRE